MDSSGRTEGERTRRRRFLAVAAAVGVAGCAGGPLGSNPGVEAEASTSTPTPTAAAGTIDAESPTGETVPEETSEASTADASDVAPKEHEVLYTVDIDHPATRELGREPTIGNHPDETGAIIVEFQDISCGVCAKFDAQTFPRVYANLIQPGKATFVSRDFPHTDEWTHPATHALDATYARDHDAYWELKSRYYAYQHEYTMDIIYPRTREWLADHTTLDPDAVLRDVRSEAYASAIERDMSAKQAADVTGTPTFFLFRDGEYRTTLTGNQDYKIFENALGY